MSCVRTSDLTRWISPVPCMTGEWKQFQWTLNSMCVASAKRKIQRGEKKRFFFSFYFTVHHRLHAAVTKRSIGEARWKCVLSLIKFWYTCMAECSYEEARYSLPCSLFYSSINVALFFFFLVVVVCCSLPPWHYAYQIFSRHFHSVSTLLPYIYIYVLCHDSSFFFLCVLSDISVVVWKLFETEQKLICCCPFSLLEWNMAWK